jgi:hypothetical protein
MNAAIFIFYFQNFSLLATENIQNHFFFEVLVFKNFVFLTRNFASGKIRKKTLMQMDGRSEAKRDPLDVVVGR